MSRSIVLFIPQLIQAYWPSAPPQADGTRWEQSNYGDFIDLAAPGTAQFPVGYKGPPGSYAGTSIASAYVARALAGYFTRYPEATAQDALAALDAAVKKDPKASADPYFGRGLLDAEALQRLLERK